MGDEGHADFPEESGVLVQRVLEHRLVDQVAVDVGDVPGAAGRVEAPGGHRVFRAGQDQGVLRAPGVVEHPHPVGRVAAVVGQASALPSLPRPFGREPVVVVLGRGQRGVGPGGPPSALVASHQPPHAVRLGVPVEQLPDRPLAAPPPVGDEGLGHLPRRLDPVAVLVLQAVGDHRVHPRHRQDLGVVGVHLDRGPHPGHHLPGFAGSGEPPELVAVGLDALALDGGAALERRVLGPEILGAPQRVDRHVAQHGLDPCVGGVGVRRRAAADPRGPLPLQGPDVEPPLAGVEEPVDLRHRLVDRGPGLQEGNPVVLDHLRQSARSGREALEDEAAALHHREPQGVRGAHDPPVVRGGVVDLVGRQPEGVEHGLGSGDDRADEGDDPLGLPGGTAGVAQDRGLPAPHLDRREFVDLLPLRLELPFRPPDRVVPEDVPALRKGWPRKKAQPGETIVDDEFLVALMGLLEGRKDPIDDPPLPLDGLELPGADALPPRVAQDELRDADPLVVGQKGLHGRLRGPVHDPPHVVFQPVAVPGLDRVPRGLENVRPMIMKVRCEGPGVGPPRFSAVAGVGHHRNAAQSRRQHRRVSRKDAFVALGGFHPHLRPADRLVPRPKGFFQLFPGVAFERGEDDALDVRLVDDLQELAHGVAAVGDLARKALVHGGVDAPRLLAQLLRHRRQRRPEALTEDGLGQVAAKGQVDRILFQLPGPVPHPVAVLGDDHLGAHVVDGVAEDVGPLGPEHEVVGRPDQGRRQLGDQPDDVRGHVDDDHVPPRHPHVDQDVRQAVDLPPDPAIGVRPHVHVLPVLLVLADVDHMALVQKALRLELVEDRPGGVDPSVLEAADHREAAQVEGYRRPLAPRVRVDHVELELLGMGEPCAACHAPAHLRFHQRPERAELVGDPLVRPLGVAEVDAKADGPVGISRGGQNPAPLPAVVRPPGKDIFAPFVGETRVFRERAARGNGGGRDRRPESLRVGQNDSIQVAVELPGHEALREAEDALQVGEAGGHLLDELELQLPGFVLRVESLLREGVDEKLRHPHRLGRGRSHRRQGFPRKEILSRRGPLQAGEDVPQVPPVRLPEPEVPVDHLRKLANPLREGFPRAPPLFQEGQDPALIEGCVRFPELGKEPLDVASRVPLGQTQADRLHPAHGGRGQTVEPGRRGPHPPRKKPGGAVSRDESDLHLRELNPRGRIGNKEVRRRRDPHGRAGAQTASHADRRDPKTADPVAQCLLVREKPVRLPAVAGIETKTHPLDEIHARREIFPAIEEQGTDRAVSGHPIHELDEAGDVLMPQRVPPIRAPETQDGNPVRPDVQLDPVHPFGPIDPISRAAAHSGYSDACILSPLETIRRCEVSLRPLIPKGAGREVFPDVRKVSLGGIRLMCASTILRLIEGDGTSRRPPPSHGRYLGRSPGSCGCWCPP